MFKICVAGRVVYFAGFRPWFGPGSNFSFVKVDPRLDLNGPQLDYAGAHPHMVRIRIDTANNWAPAGHFWQLPQQLWPYQQNPVFNYATSSDSWGTDEPATQPPGHGVWRSNQVVLSPFNSSNTTSKLPRGWVCVEGGKPGIWEPLAN